MAIVLTVYVRTMYRTVPGGDSGELIVGISLSISHTRGLLRARYEGCFKGVSFKGVCVTAGCTGGIAHPP